MKITLQGYVHHKPDWDGKDRYYLFSHDMSDCGYTMVGTVDIDYEVPASFNPVAAEVARLNTQLDKLADEYHGKVAQIKGRINDLLCLEVQQ